MSVGSIGTTGKFPPGLARIFPIQVQVTGTTDQSGSWSNAPGQQLHNSYWSLFKLVATCWSEYSYQTGSQNNVRWEVTSGGNRPLDFGYGADISTGPILVGPGEMVNIRCTGSTPGTPVRGQFTGVMAPHVSDIIMQYVPAPTPLNPGVDQTASLSALSSIQAALERMSPPPAPPAPPFVIQGSTS